MADDDRTESTLLPESVLSNSPSLQDGVSATIEQQHRIWACELIQEAGILLKLPQVVMCTAQNLLHRFLYRKSLVRFDGFVTAMGCFFLACKIEEKPKRIRETLMAFHYIWKRRSKQAEAKLELGGPRYNYWKAELIKIERHILKELGFSFYIIDHAHKFILFYIKFLDGDRALAQRSWSYLNDSMRTDMCLRYRAEVIACAAIFMAARSLELKLPTDDPWWEVFHVKKVEMDVVVQSILDLYTIKPRCWLAALTPKPHLTDDEFEGGRVEQPAVTPPPAPVETADDLLEEVEEPVVKKVKKDDDERSGERKPRPDRSPRGREDRGGRDRDRRDRDRDRRDRRDNDRRDDRRDNDRRDRDKDDHSRRSKRSPDRDSKKRSPERDKNSKRGDAKRNRKDD